MTVPAIAAPLLSLLGGGGLAMLPASAERAGQLLPACLGAAVLALVVVAGVGGASIAADFGLLAALLGATLATVCSGSGARRRPRLARAGPAWLTGCVLLAVGGEDDAVAVCALIAAGLLAALAAGAAGGAAASLAAWRLLRLQAVASAVALLGLLLRGGGHSVLADAGAGLLMLGAAAIGGLAPFGGALAGAGEAAAPLVPLAIALLPLGSFALLLRARLLLVRDGLATGADGALMASGLLAMTLGAAFAWTRPRGGGRDAAVCTGLLGLVAFGFGLGGVAGLHAGLVALLAATIAAPARLLAREADGAIGRWSVLAGCCLPPFGLFAAAVLLIEATLPVQPLLLAPLVVLLALLLTGGLRDAGAPGAPGARTIRVVLGIHLALSAVIGVALPAAVSERLVDLAESLAR